MDWRHSRPFRISLLLVFSITLIAAVLPRLISIDLVRNELAAKLLSETGRTLSVNGATRILLLPHPEIVLNDVSLSEPRSGKIFAEASQLRANLALWPLLKRQLSIRSLEFEAPRLNVMRREDGRYNFEDLLLTRDSARVQIALENVHFRDAALLLADEQGRRLRVTALDLAMTDLSDSRSGQLTAAGVLLAGEEGHAAAWQGKLNAQAAVRYHKDEKQLRIADLILDIQQQGHAVDGIEEAQLKATGKLVYGWNPLRLSGGELKLEGGLKRAGQNWSLALNLPSIRVSPAALALEKFSLSAKMQSASGSFSTEVLVPEFVGATGQLLRAEKAEIHARLHSPEQQLILDFTSPLELEALVVARLNGYQLQGQYGNRDLPRGAIPFELEGDGLLDLREEKLELDSSGLLDHAALEASVRIEDFIAPRYSFDLDLARLDLTPYLPAVTAGAKEIDQERAFDFWWLNRLRANGSVKIGELVLQKMRVNDLAFQLKAADRKLVLEPLDATIYEGRLSGRAEIDTNLSDGRRAPAFRLQQRLSNMNITPLFADLFKTERFSGRGHLDLDLAAVGNKLTDLRRTAGGNIKAQLNAGSIQGIDIEALVRAAASQLQQTDSKPKPILNSHTAFSALRANLVVRHGIITNNDLNIATRDLQLSGAGFMDLPAGNMDYTIKAKTRSQAPELKKLAGLTLPIQLVGPLNAPEYKVDYADLKEQIIARQSASKPARK